MRWRAIIQHYNHTIHSRSTAAKSTVARPPTNVSTVTASPRSSAPSSPGSTRPSENNSVLARRIKSDVKLMLLDRAEKEIISVYNNACSIWNPDLRVRSYLAMAYVALTLCQPSLATQLSLAALRYLQSTKKNSDLGESEAFEKSFGLSSSRLSQSAADLRLWLECRSVLAKSLIGASNVWLQCEEVCSDGCEESEACGDLEMWAEFHLIAAEHALSVESPNLDLIQGHAQVSRRDSNGLMSITSWNQKSLLLIMVVYTVCLYSITFVRTLYLLQVFGLSINPLQAGLELLNSLSEHCPHNLLLQSKLSLMLCDVSCLLASAVPREMLEVFHGLIEMLNNQVSECGFNSASFPYCI